jgi:putative membrane protein
MQEVVGVLAVLASNDHGWFWFWPLIPLFWLLLFFVFFRLFFWRGRRGPWGPYRQAASDPRTILAERYARGEITNDEYRERLGNLEP